jgi:hypothetical protein
MAFPAFFDQVPALRMHDALAQLLGTSPDGMMDYHYADAVRLAGHSCPTVAGTWLSVRAGLQALFPGEIPQRGGISVYLPDPEDHGVTGVIAQILTLVTGAAADNGFKGLGAPYARNHLLHYAEPGVDGMRLRRNDDGRAVEVQFDASSVPSDPAVSGLMSAVLSDHADEAQRRQFGELWQDRVRRLLLDHADDPAVICVQPLSPAS